MSSCCGISLESSRNFSYIMMFINEKYFQSEKSLSVDTSFSDKLLSDIFSIDT
jgi:hypothetical protein